jgi:cytochrome c553
MLRKILKWTGLFLLVAVTLLAGIYVFIKTNIDNRISKPYTFQKHHLQIKSDSAILARGKHLSVIKGCTDCHGGDLGGKVMNDDGAIGKLVASNLTKGDGGLAENYTTTDWITALRHGIDRNGRPLLFMPSHEYALLSEQDLSALIAYCESVKPVNRRLPSSEIGPIAYIMSYYDKFPLLAVEKIEHAKPMIAKADSTEGIAQGKYLAVSCSGCHQPDFKGGAPLAPGLPPVPDITSSGNLGKWTQNQFINTLRTGKTPSGHQMSNDNMPWQMTAQYKQSELVSLYKFLSSEH